MPTHRQRFTGSGEEDFPAPPIARRLQPGDVIEYEADEPVRHARLEPADQPQGWERFPHHVEGLSAVYRRVLGPEPVEAPAEPPVPPKNRRAAAEPASTDKED